MANGVTYVSQKTEDCNAECWQYDRERKRTGRFTEQTKDGYNMCAGDNLERIKNKKSWVMDTSYTITEKHITEMESALWSAKNGETTY